MINQLATLFDACEINLLGKGLNELDAFMVQKETGGGKITLINPGLRYLLLICSLNVN